MKIEDLFNIKLQTNTLPMSLNNSICINFNNPLQIYQGDSLVIQFTQEGYIVKAYIQRKEIG